MELTFLCKRTGGHAQNNRSHVLDFLAVSATSRQAGPKATCSRLSGAAQCVPARAADTLSLAHDARTRGAFLPVSCWHFLSHRCRAVVPACDLSRAGPEVPARSPSDAILEMQSAAGCQRNGRRLWPLWVKKTRTSTSSTPMRNVRCCEPRRPRRTVLQLP